MLNRIIYYTQKIVSPLNFIMGKLSVILLFAMMMLTFSDVVARMVVRPIQGTHELTYLSLALIVFLSLGYTQEKKGHISVGVLVDLLPKRIQALIDVVFYFIMIILLGLLAWQTFEFGLRGINSVTGDLGIPVYIFIFICVIGIIIYALSTLVDFLKAIQEVVISNDS